MCNFVDTSYNTNHLAPVSVEKPVKCSQLGFMLEGVGEKKVVLEVDQ